MASASGSNQALNEKNSSHFLRTVCLEDWWLIKAEKDFNGKRLAVGGLTSKEQKAVRVFTSAPIINRLDVFTLETADEITIVIKGFMNKSRTHENGFPLEVSNHFLFGFPQNWEVYTNECFVRESTLGDEPENEVLTVNFFKEKSEIVSNDSSMVPQSNTKEPDTYRKKTKRKLEYNLHVTPPITRDRKKKLSIVSPESLSLRRSRSGRLLVPTLDFWHNQQLVYDVDGRISGIQKALPVVESPSGTRSKPQKKKKKLT